MLLDERHILLEELLLEGFGGSRDDHAPAAAQRGDQVGERLAGTGAGLDNRVAPLAEGFLHRAAHFQL